MGLEFNFTVLIPVLTLGFYLIINWKTVKNKPPILIPLLIGGLLWFIGLLGIADNNAIFIWSGFSIFILGLILHSYLAFREALLDKDVP